MPPPPKRTTHRRRTQRGADAGEILTVARRTTPGEHEVDQHTGIDCCGLPGSQRQRKVSQQQISAPRPQRVDRSLSSQRSGRCDDPAADRRLAAGPSVFDHQRWHPSNPPESHTTGRDQCAARCARRRGVCSPTAPTLPARPAHGPAQRLDAVSVATRWIAHQEGIHPFSAGLRAAPAFCTTLSECSNGDLDRSSLTPGTSRPGGFDTDRAVRWSDVGRPPPPHLQRTAAAPQPRRNGATAGALAG